MNKLYTTLTTNKAESVQHSYLDHRSMMSSCRIRRVLCILHRDTDPCHCTNSE